MDIKTIKCQLVLLDNALAGPFAFSNSGKMNEDPFYAMGKSKTCKKSKVYQYHLQYELIKVITGKLLLKINDQEYHLTKNQYAWIGAGQLHRIESMMNQNMSDSNDDCSYQSVFFDLEKLSTSFKDINDFMELISSSYVKINTVYDKSDKDDSEICLCFDRFIDTVQMLHIEHKHNHGYSSYLKRNAQELIALGQLLECLGTIKLYQRYTSYEDKFNNSSKASLQKSVILMRYIYENYCSALTLDNLAKLVDLQPNYLCRYFKELTGKRPFDYINSLRINEASRRLSNTNHSIYQIAYSCGFQDPCYFTRIFKKHMGISPSTFRKQSRAKNN